MDRFLSFLGLAMKANRVLFGTDPVQNGIARARLIIVASDAGGAVHRNAAHLSEKHGIPCITARHGKSDLGHAIGKKPCAIISVTDRGFAENLIGHMAKPD